MLCSDFLCRSARIKDSQKLFVFFVRPGTPRVVGERAVSFLTLNRPIECGHRNKERANDLRTIERTARWQDFSGFWINPVRKCIDDFLRL